VDPWPPQSGTDVNAARAAADADAARQACFPRHAQSSVFMPGMPREAAQQNAILAIILQNARVTA
jgi:hypothetical protein